MKLPAFVKMVEVGPRDGLQNEPRTVPLKVKLKLIEKLSRSGLQFIEATSFVSPLRVPQMADHSELMQALSEYRARFPGIAYPALVPNLHGLEQALLAGTQEIAIFAAASETFSKRNINCSIVESFERFKQLMPEAKRAGLSVRGYVSCVMGCPYEGEVSAEKVAEVSEQLYQLGCDEISLGDTIGVGTVNKTQNLLEAVLNRLPVGKIAVHFHDTYGQSLANIYAALQMGIHIIDSSVAGLGGCPYARGATGNVASEDVLYLLNGLGIETGVSLKKLIKAGKYISDYLKRPNHSKVGAALLAKIS